MPYTAKLLKKLKLSHTLDAQDPLLSIPLSLFKETEHAELISIMWLMENKWINSAKAPKSGAVMGQLSSKHVQQFFGSIKRQVQALINLSNGPLEAMSTQEYTILKPEGSWVNPTLVTHSFSKNPIYNLLRKCTKCTHELNFFLPWFNGQFMGQAEQNNFAQYLHGLNTNGTLQASVDALASTLVNLEPFTSHQYPQSYIYQCIIRINKLIANPTEDSVYPEILSYYHEVLISLARQYPPTLESLFISLGIQLPETIDPMARLMLEQNLLEIPGLTENQWPDLVYYASLFIFGHAKADPHLLNYTYAGKEFPASLKVLAQKHAKQFKPFIAKIEQCTSAVKADYNSGLTADLVATALNYHPKQVALFCFESCAPLRDLFDKAWQAPGKKVTTYNKVALKPSMNQFVFGRLYTKPKCTDPIAISNHDLDILVELHQIAKDTKIPPAEKLPLGQKRAGTFFAQTPTIEFLEQGRRRDASRVAFIILQSQIEDLILRKSISLGSMAENADYFMTAFALNLEALSDFVSDYGVNAPRPSPVALEDFFEAFPKNTTLNTLIDELARDKTFIDLGNVPTLKAQKATLNHKLIELSDKLALLPKSQKDEEVLYKKWLEAQVYIYKGFKNKLLDKIKILEENRLHPEQNLEDIPSFQP